MKTEKVGEGVVWNLPDLGEREYSEYEPIASEDDSVCLEQSGEYEIRNIREEQLLTALTEKEELKKQLAAMTEDRDLWQDAHNEDCPNLALRTSVVSGETVESAWERGQITMRSVLAACVELGEGK